MVDGLAEALVEVGDGILEAFLDVALDVPLDAVRVAGAEVRDECRASGTGTML